ncbi:hypothetical protein SAMN02910451_03112 [Butyrivibrio hungatei]|uniref:Uncharacterized protein n=1 Tax=Butyrivibrio hungatei TaxID=185008 RepID=A0A1G5GYC3_9FIRM|nr:DUF6715 family protein [Butyrivibrio hungatei]MBQ4219169.1 hypothetical protein [Butyrivibrio sp.]MEE3471814.1 DUF6715 family protein [Butyrivibrio hungatei]SCY56592.1 hypothetical protein SAMN02910451_03112 [Butyrivibrio hungatei]
MENNSVKSAIMKSIVLLALGAVVVVGLYFMFVGSKKSPEEEQYNLTAVDEITTTNLEKNYPANPRMVVDLYAKTMQVLYKEEYTEGQQDKMLYVLKGIMDDELLEKQVDFSRSMKNEISERKEGDYSISNYLVQNTEPEVVTVSGKKMCNVQCLFSLRKGTSTVANYYQFILRQDDDKRWKILGWDVNTKQ